MRDYIRRKKFTLETQPLQQKNINTTSNIQLNTHTEEVKTQHGQNTTTSRKTTKKRIQTNLHRKPNHNGTRNTHIHEMVHQKTQKTIKKTLLIILFFNYTFYI